MTLLAPPRAKLWTVEEYKRLLACGGLDECRVELLDGEIIDMPAQGPDHVVAVRLASAAMTRIFPPESFTVGVQLAIEGDDSMPEPDVYVCLGSPREVPPYPTRPLLIIEVAKTSLDYDRRRKGPTYARAGIEDYWVVNLNDRILEVYRQPHETATGWAYAPPLVLDGQSHIQPLALPGERVAVADLLP